MGNISIRRKLVISFASLTVFIILLSFLSTIFLRNVNRENDELYNHPFTVTNAIKDIEVDIRILYSSMQEIIQPVNASEIDNIKTRIVLYETEIEEKMLLLYQFYLGDIQDVIDLEDAYEQSIITRNQVIEYVEDGNYVEAQNFKNSIGTSIRDEIFAKTNIITTFAEAKAIALRESVDTKTRNYLITMIIVSVVLVATTIVGFIALIRDIYPSISALIETLESHRTGGKKNTLSLKRKDEIGEVSRALNDMLAFLSTQKELSELTLKLENVKNQELLRITLLSIGEAVITTDLNSVISEINPVAEELTGYTREEAIGLHSEDVFRIVHANTNKKLSNPIDKALQKRQKIVQKHSTLLISKDNNEYIIASSVAPIIDEKGNSYGVVLIFRDITEEMEQQEKIKFLSQHDGLTKLKNRNFLEEKLLQLQEKNVPNVGIIMGDVNGLKITNDAFGHSFGDALLIDISNILIESTKNYFTTVVRWGGDEFVLVVENITEKKLDELCQLITSNCEKSKSNGPVIPNISLGHCLRVDPKENLYRTLINAEDMMYENKLLEKDSNRSKIVSSLESSLYEKSYETEEHALRVAEYSQKIAVKLNLHYNEVNKIILLAKLHDIGKISIDDSVLNKKEKLTAEEWKLIRRHPETGYRIASSLNELTHIAEGILNHHEHYDGQGYPRGISGTQIPLMSRIIAVADAFDVMTSDRPYKPKISVEEACEELKRCKSKQFDPELVDLFIKEIIET